MYYPIKVVVCTMNGLLFFLLLRKPTNCLIELLNDFIQYSFFLIYTSIYINDLNLEMYTYIADLVGNIELSCLLNFLVLIYID